METTRNEAVDTAIATTKVCKVCERELPLSEFRTVVGGNKVNTCYTCSNAKRAETFKAKRMGGVSRAASNPFTMRTSRASNLSKLYS